MEHDNRSHYEVLRIAVTATEKDIKSAYRKAARRAHPDHGGDAAAFRQVTLAYETLIDPQRRAAYDRSYARATYRTGAAGHPGQAGSSQGRGEGGYTTGPSSSFRPGTRRPATPQSTAGDPPFYVPAYGIPGEVPLIPEAEAARQVHGMPRKRGIFGAEARIQREMQTVQLLVRQVLSGIPAARLVNGLQSPSDNGHIDHAVLSGYRLALIDSMMLPKGAYAWDGAVLRHGSRSVAPPRLDHIVRQMQDIFPELNVTAWIVVHSPGGNLHEPVIDQFRRNQESGPVQVVNAAGLVRGVKQFLSSGPAPNTVVVPVLARLLRGMH